MDEENADRERKFWGDVATYWHCETRDHRTFDSLSRALRHLLHPINLLDFKSFLASAILNKSISIEDYEKVTGLDFETRSDVAVDLAALWKGLFGDDVVSIG